MCIRDSVKYSDILEHTTNPQDTDLRAHTRHDELLYVVVDNQIPHTYGQPIVVGHRDGCFRSVFLDYRPALVLHHEHPAAAHAFLWRKTGTGG